MSRASLHNISYIKALELGTGDKISVFKANMIIPQIAENFTRSGKCDIPDKCPVCGGEVSLKNENDVETLYCINKVCPAKHIKSFVHFVSRDAINIEGLSEATIDKFIQHRFLRHLPDLYSLEGFKDEITALDGFGEKSYEKLIKAIEASKTTRLYRLLYGMGIPGFGSANCKLVSKVYDTPEKIVSVNEEELTEIDGLGEVLARDFVRFFKDEENLKVFNDLSDILTFEQEESTGEKPFEDVTFVITGSLNGYENRNILKEYIESLGGKVSGSVSSKTSYLINNDATSSSGKNKKAKELGVKIITEDEFENLVKSLDLR